MPAQVKTPEPFAQKQMASTRTEPVLQDLLSSLSPEILSAAKEVYQKLLFNIRSECRIYNQPFQELLVEDQTSGEYMTEVDDTIHCDSLYNSIQIAVSANSNCDLFHVKNMSVVPEVQSVAIALGSVDTYTFMHCSWKLNSSCVKEIENVADSAKEAYVLMYDYLPSRKNRTFELMCKANQDVSETGRYQSGPQWIVCTIALLQTAQSIFDERGYRTLEFSGKWTAIRSKGYQMPIQDS